VSSRALRITPVDPPRGVQIHPTAIVDPGAALGVGVEIGPYAIVEAGAEIGDRTRVMAHAFVAARCTLGPDCEVHMGAVLGHAAQVRGLTGPGGGLAIGARNILREYVTIHRSCRPGQRTVVGDDNFLLGHSHVAHDCRLGSGVTIANGSLLAGYVTVDDRAFISGNVVVHQDVRLGELCMVGGNARVGKDVPPFVTVVERSRVCGLNAVGLRRAGLAPAPRAALRQAYRILYRSGLSVSHALDRLRAMPPTPEIVSLIDFVEHSTRGICAAGPRGRRLVSDDEAGAEG
jgi:UDP-N-acetylglucosamine acyltransferase